MQLSRPVSVLAVMAILVAAAAWYAPAQNPAAQHTAVMLPAATYDLLLVKGKSLPTADGHPRTAAQVIEMLAAQ